MARMLNTDLPERPVYPWHQWLDGHTWSLKPGRDFVVSITTMQVMAGRMGRRLGITVRTQKVNGLLHIQAVR